MISDISIVKCAMFSGKTGPRFRCVGHSRHVVYAARSGASGETAAKHQQRGSRFLTSAAPTDAARITIHEFVIIDTMFFLPRVALCYSALYCYARSSVCPSICLCVFDVEENEHLGVSESFENNFVANYL